MSENESHSEYSLTPRQIVQIENQLRRGGSVSDELKAAYDRRTPSTQSEEPIVPVTQEAVVPEKEPTEEEKQEQQRKERITTDLVFVLSPDPEETKPESANYDEAKKNEYRKKIGVAKQRLVDEGINVDVELKKQPFETSDYKKEIGTRRAALLAAVEKMRSGEILNNEENEIVTRANIEADDLAKKEEKEPAVVEHELNPEEIEKLRLAKENDATEETRRPEDLEFAWQRDLAKIEGYKDLELQGLARARWLKENLRNPDVPYDVLMEQLDKTQGVEPGVPTKQREKTKKPVAPEEPKKTVENGGGKKEEIFNEREMYTIVKKCFDMVFDDPNKKSSLGEVMGSLYSISGVISSDLGRGKDPVLSLETIKRIENLGIENWSNVRETIANWASLKKVEEIKEGTLTEDLFMGEFAEDFFAHKTCELPGKMEGGRLVNGEVELVKVEMQPEVSDAMKKIRKHFAESMGTDGRPMLVEYWGMIGDPTEKQRLYEELNINKYIGETAFTLLISYQMLTDSSAEDIMGTMVRPPETKVRKYKVSEERDSFVRMMMVDEIAKGEEPFTRLSGSERSIKMDEMAKKVAQIVPSQLIPTGFSGEFTDEVLTEEEQRKYSEAGAYHLDKGDWLKWRVDKNLYSANQYNSALIAYNQTLALGNVANPAELAFLEAKVKPATDQGTRLTQMRSALTILNTMKTIQAPESNIGNLEELKGKLYRHMTGSFGDNGWLKKREVDGVLTVPAAFCFRDMNGRLADMPLQEWISRAMMGMDKVFLYSHSIVDSENPKPLAMNVIAEYARQLFKSEVQSGKPTFFGMEKGTAVEHRKDMLKFIDKLWNRCYDLIYPIARDTNPNRYPKWWDQRVKPLPEIVKMATESRQYVGLWDGFKKEL
jgi:hypothetical protein